MALLRSWKAPETEEEKLAKEARKAEKVKKRKKEKKEDDGVKSEDESPR